MAKIGIFKKVAALATAIAIVLCFAVTVSAEVTVTTKTSYFGIKNEDIKVEVKIAGEEIADKSVSYYAFDSEGSPVYIDQFDDGNATVTFDYVTDTADLYSDVKVGYTGADAATSSQIDARTVTWDKSEGEDPVAYIPTEATEATVTFATDATAVTSCTADKAEVNYELTSGESITIILSKISGPVTLTIETQAQAIAKIIDAAFVVSNGSDDIVITDENKDVVDTAWRQHVKLTAIGKVTGATDYGVIVCEKDATYTEDDWFKAVAKTTSGHFAVQLIDDNSDDATFINKNKKYDVRAYADTTVSPNKETVECVDLTKKN